MADVHKAKNRCPVCEATGKLFHTIQGAKFLKCLTCSLIYVDPNILAAIDSGESLVNYSDAYWSDELDSSMQRARGSSVARVAELFYYSRVPIRTFLDLGTGAGHLLDQLKILLPETQVEFFGVELMPPAPQYRSKHPGYRVGWLDQFQDGAFDAGSCIEVLEHLTPHMVEKLFADLSRVSKEDSSWIMNTGLSAYVSEEDLAYLDPFSRGHIVSWSLQALQILAGKSGWSVVEIPGKTWCFLLEKQSNPALFTPLSQRIWNPEEENISSIRSSIIGNLLVLLGLESARAYGR
jgi:hypothetical protein